MQKDWNETPLREIPRYLHLIKWALEPNKRVPVTKELKHYRWNDEKWSHPLGLRRVICDTRSIWHRCLTILPAGLRAYQPTFLPATLAGIMIKKPLAAWKGKDKAEGLEAWRPEWGGRVNFSRLLPNVLLLRNVSLGKNSSKVYVYWLWAAGRIYIVPYRNASLKTPSLGESKLASTRVAWVGIPVQTGRETIEN